MSHYYAVIDDAGKCYEVRHSIIPVCDPHYVVISNYSIEYLSKYYWPVLKFVDCDTDFSGDWYLDASHSVKEVRR